MGEVTAYLTAVVVAFLMGVILTNKTNLPPIEHHLQKYCTDIGSTLKEYNRSGELVCENGATFKYSLEDK